MATLTIQLAKIVKERKGNLSQMQIAEETKISQSTVSRWMSGKIDRFDKETIEKFCEWLDCDAGDLLHIERSKS